MPCSYAPTLASKPLVVYGFPIGFRSSFFFHQPFLEWKESQPIISPDWRPLLREKTTTKSHLDIKKLPIQSLHNATRTKKQQNTRVICPWDPQTASAKEVRKSPVPKRGIVEHGPPKYISAMFFLG